MPTVTTINDPIKKHKLLVQAQRGGYKVQIDYTDPDDGKRTSIRGWVMDVMGDHFAFKDESQKGTTTSYEMKEEWVLNIDQV